MTTITLSAAHQSIWLNTASMPKGITLRGSHHADVCIVGGGIAGLTTAYLLMQHGKSVIVVDDGPLAGGMTSMTTAHLSNAVDDRFVNIERWHGAEGARMAAASHAAAIDFIESLARDLNSECDFRRVEGHLFRAPDDGAEEDLLALELAAAHRAGIQDAEIVSHAPFTSFDTGPAIRFLNQGRFHPLKYLASLASAIEKGGGKLFVDSHVDQIEGGTPAQIKVGKHTITADAVVVATNSPINDMFAIHTKQAPYMTYVIGAKVPRGSVADVLLWDTLEAYHYVRLQPGETPEYDMLIVGGEDHKSGQADESDNPHGKLEEWARERFPMMGEVELVWGGQVMETVDGLAFIGRNPMDKENVYVVTGDSGMGITHGTIAGMLLTDLILGRENPWAELYNPSRKTLRAAGTFLKENLNVAGQYADWITPGDVNSANDIALGCGAVVRRGMSKIAVYRDEHGKLTELSAVCPHLQCVVQWNQVESTWDCPCHGSRFLPDGQVINGPANVNLAVIEDDV